jgi:branched-chain amino acid transport system ATP-binding protein
VLVPVGGTRAPLTAANVGDYRLRVGDPAGMKERLEIARALATQPEVLLLDEVMAGLRPAEAREAVGLVRSVQESGVTVIFIEHVMPVVRDLADRVVVMDYGKKLAEGSYAEVTRHPKVIEAYLGSEEVA